MKKYNVKFNNELTQDELKKLFYYDPETGNFTNLTKTNQNVIIGSIAGSMDKRGYCRIAINKVKYSNHRLAWLYVYGKFPIECIDHINRNPSDNRLCNLREATFQENSRNRDKSSLNKSGYKGVVWVAKDKKWRAGCKSNSIAINLGNYSTAEEASEVYENYVKNNYGEFYYNK